MAYPDRVRFLYIARHGETDFNKEGRLQGHTDRPLNDTGRAQALAMAERMRPFGLARVGASTLSRAAETASICAGALGVPADYADSDFRERAYGAFEGLTRDELLARHAEEYRAWQENNRFTPPGAESYQELVDRMLRATVRAADEAQKESGNLLVVSHGGAMRALVFGATGKTLPPLANGTVFRVVFDGAQIVSFDEP